MKYIFNFSNFWLSNISIVADEGYYRNVLCALNYISMFSLLSLGRFLAGGLLVLAGIIHPVVSAWELTWFNRYIYY